MIEEKKYCDICKKEIDSIDRAYFFSYGEKSSIPGFGKSKKGDICRECLLIIRDFIDKLKKK